MTRIFTTLLLSGLFSLSANAENLSTVVMKDKLETTPNYVFSNVSIDGLLTLVAPGYDSERQAQLEQYWNGVSIDNKSQEVLGLNRDQEGLLVSVNNQVWIDKEFEFLPQYVDALANNFSVTPQTMDNDQPAETADAINQWASDNTNELIKDVIKQDQINSDVVSVLANAVYFKGEWEEKFDADNTVDAPFYGVTNNVPTMTKKAEGATYVPVTMVMDKAEGVLLVEIPFKGESHALVVAMPAEALDVGFSTDFVYDQNSGDVEKVFQDYIANGQAFTSLQERGYTLDFTEFQMPKFEVESEIKGVEKMLSGLGMDELFEAGVLSNMSNDPRAKLSKVFQKAKIIINEEGGEAAAVSVGTIVLESAIMPQGRLLINGPFAYAIRDNESSVTLFEGVVKDPSAE